MAVNTDEKRRWVLECEYDCRCDLIKEWGKVNKKSPDYTFKSSMSIGIKIIGPYQTLKMFQEYQGGAVTSQISAK